MDHRAIAKRLLVHYFKLCVKESGLHWDSDNETEIEAIVDEIIDAMKQELRDEGMFQRGERE